MVAAYLILLGPFPSRLERSYRFLWETYALVTSFEAMEKVQGASSIELQGGCAFQAAKGT